MRVSRLWGLGLLLPLSVFAAEEQAAPSAFYTVVIVVLAVAFVVAIGALSAARLKLHQLEEYIQQLAHLDDLTGVASRQFALASAEKAMSEALRYKFPVSLLLVSVNELDTINDIYSDECGDFLLKKIAARLHTLVRDTDVIGRYSGSEFILFLPHTPGENLHHLIKRVYKPVEKEKVDFRGQEVLFTISIGGASSDDKPEDLKQLIDTAARRLKLAQQKPTQQVALTD